MHLSVVKERLDCNACSNKLIVMTCLCKQHVHYIHVNIHSSTFLFGSNRFLPSTIKVLFLCVNVCVCVWAPIRFVIWSICPWTWALWITWFQTHYVQKKLNFKTNSQCTCSISYSSNFGSEWIQTGFIWPYKRAFNKSLTGRKKPRHQWYGW